MFIDPPKGRSEVVAKYTYTDQFGKPAFQVRRYFPKDFRAYSARTAGVAGDLGSTVPAVCCTGCRR